MVPSRSYLFLNMIIKGASGVPHTRAVTGTHFATRVPAYQYPAGTRLLGGACSELFRALNGYPGSNFITRVVLLPAGTRVPVNSSTRHCIWTPDCPLKLSCYRALNPTKRIHTVKHRYMFKGIPSTWLQKFYVSISIGIVHFRPPDVPLREKTAPSSALINNFWNTQELT